MDKVPETVKVEPEKETLNQKTKKEIELLVEKALEKRAPKGRCCVIS